MTEGQIRVAIAVLAAHQRGDIADDPTIDDALYDELTEAIEAALEEMPPYTVLSA
jgi:hypothetical protein